MPPSTLSHPLLRMHPQEGAFLRLALSRVSEYGMRQQRCVWQRCDATHHCHESCWLEGPLTGPFYFSHPY